METSKNNIYEVLTKFLNTPIQDCKLSYWDEYEKRTCDILEFDKEIFFWYKNINAIGVCLLSNSISRCMIRDPMFHDSVSIKHYYYFDKDDHFNNSLSTNRIINFDFNPNLLLVQNKINELTPSISHADIYGAVDIFVNQLMNWKL